METEHKIEQAKLNEMKKIVEQEIAEYSKENRWSSRSDYFNNFDLYLQYRPNSPKMNYRGIGLEEGIKNKTNRELLKHPEGGYYGSPTDRYLDASLNDFINEIDQGMEMYGLTLDQVMKLYDKKSELLINDPYGDDYKKAEEDFVDKILFVYVYMRALGYNHSELIC